MTDAPFDPLLDEPELEEGLVLRICHGPTCGKRSASILEAARRYIARHRLEGEVAIAGQHCFGKCSVAPNVLFERWVDGGPDERAMWALAMNQEHPAMRFEHGVAAGDIAQLIARHLDDWYASR